MAAPEPSTYDSMYFSTAGMPTRWQKSPRASSAVARWVFHMAKIGSTVSSRSSYFILKSDVGWPVRPDWSGLPPSQSWYAFGPEPTSAISAMYGRAQPLGQPVVRVTKVEVAEAHLLQLVHEAGVDIGLHALRLGDGEAAEREGRARDRLARDRVDLVDHIDPVHLEARLDAHLVRRLNVAEDDRLRGREQQVDAGEVVDHRAQARLEAELWRVAHAPLLDVDAQHVLAVALLVPAHPVEVLPLGQRPPRLDLLAQVLLGERAEVVDAERVHEVLEPGGRAHLAVAVVALHRQDRLHRLEKALLAHKAQVRRGAGKRRLVL